MSKTIDERVVSMQFDNKHFENNVQTSMGTLDKLKNSLKLDGASKGLENVNAATKNFDVSPLAKGVETIRSKFSALEVMAVTALANITNSAINAGKKLVASFTIEPIKKGFQEYETQINAVQTILANTQSKGTTLEDVNGALDTLNKYADKTIYNFTEMTRNIGTFTAAGVDLDTSVNAIQGIANLAAVSGSTSQQASTAMYQLSQALASGTVKLMDWNSVVNAGMGGQVFQDALKETARAHGIAIDEMIEDEGSFRDTLQKGWLTSDVLTETLTKFTLATEDMTEAEIAKNREMLKGQGYTEAQIDEIFKLGNMATDAATKVKTFTQLMDTLGEAAQSGWTQSWEIIIGDFEEAKKLWTGLSDYFGEMIQQSADARNEVLQGWADGGGREMLIESLKNAFQGLLSIIKPIKEAFREIFPPITAEKLLVITERIKDLTSKFKLSDEQSVKLKTTFKGLFAILDIVANFLMAVGRGILQVIRDFSGFGNNILDVTAAFGEWAISVRDGIKESNMFGIAIYKITNFIREIPSKISILVDSFSDFIVSIIDTAKTFGELVRSASDFFGVSDAISSAINSIKEWFSSLKNGTSDTDIFTKSITGISDVLQKATSKIKEFKSYLEKKMEAPGFETFLTVMTKIWEIITKIGRKIGEIGVSIGKALAIAFRNGDIGNAMDLVNSGIFAAVLLGIKKFFKSATSAFDDIGGIISNVKETLDSVRGCLEAYQQNLKANVLLKIAIAIAVLAASLIALALIDPDKLNGAIGAITVLFAELMGSMALFTKMSGSRKTISSAATAMLALSIAVFILAAAMKSLGDMDMESIGRGLLGVIGLTATLVAAMTYLSKHAQKGMKGAVQAVILAAAIKILASACKDLSQLSWEELAKGLTGVTVLMAEVSLFLSKTKVKSNAIATGIGIVLLAAALKILASVCKTFADMNWEEIGKGLSGVGGLLLELFGFIKLTGKSKNLVSTGIGLIAIAAAIKILASAAKEFATMSWAEIGRGLTAMAGALAEIVIAVRLMPKNLIATGLGLAIVAASLIILSEALTRMSGMGWEEIGKGLTALGGSMLILAIGLNLMKGTLGGSAALLVAAIALSVLAPVLKTLGSMSLADIGKGLLALAGVFIIFGVAAAVLQPLIGPMLGLAAAILIFGIGCALAGAGILLISVALTSLSASIVVAAGSIVTTIVEVVNGLSDIIVSVCELIIASAPAIAKAIVALVESACFAISESAPVIVKTFFTLLIETLEMLKTFVPQLVDSLVDVLILLMDKVSERIPELVDSAVGLIEKFIVALSERLGSGNFKELLQTLEVVSLIFLELAIAAKVISTIPIAGAAQGLVGLAIVVAGIVAILGALGGLAQIPGFEWLMGEGTRVLGQIGTAIGTFVGNIAGSFVSGLTSQFPQMGQNLADFMTNLKPFVDGAKEINSSVFEGIANLAGAVILITAADVISGILSWIGGGSSLVTFGEELAEFGPLFKKYADSVAGIDADVVKNSADAASSLAEMATNLPNQGGFVSWFAGDNTLSQFAEELSKFGPELKKYADSVKGLDSDIVKKSADAASALSELATNLPNQGGVVSWFAGDNTLSQFATELAAFGPELKRYSDSVKGLDPDIVVASANAAESLSKLATNLPNQGGVVSWFTGDNTLSQFAEELAEFGPIFADYAKSIEDIDSEAVVASATAAKALSELATNLPNQGGLVSWFSGDNKLGDFGDGLIDFGKGMKAYSDKLTEGKGFNVKAVEASTNAAKSISELATNLPNSGGVVGWFTGENDLGAFGDQLVAFGKGMRSYSDELTKGKGFNSDAVVSSTNAAKSLSELATNLPNSGGVVGWFTGENSMATFGEGLVSFGKGMRSYSDELTKGKGFNSDAVVSSTNAAKSLSELATNLPNAGGVVGWFTGENSMVTFGDGLIAFGKGMRSYSDELTRDGGVNIEAVNSSTNAAKSLSELAINLPSSLSLMGWFSGENGSFTFTEGLVSFGKAMARYSEAVSGNIDEGAIIASANAGKSLLELANTIPNSGGVISFFTGEQNFELFGTQLVPFGQAMVDFSSIVSGKIDETAIAAAVNSGKLITELSSALPNTRSVVGFFTGEADLTSFSAQLSPFGTAMVDFSSTVSGKIDESAVTAAVNAGKVINELATSLPKVGGIKSLWSGDSSLSGFGSQLKTFGQYLVDFSNIVSGNIDTEAISNAIDSCRDLMDLINDMSGIDITGSSTFAKGLSDLGTISVDGFIRAITGAKPKVQSAITDMLNALTNTSNSYRGKIVKVFSEIMSDSLSTIKKRGSHFKLAGKELAINLQNGINTGSRNIGTAFTKALSSCVSKIRTYYNAFFNAGKHVATGFARGIESNTYMAQAKAKAMAEKAELAARRELMEKSPSKVFEKIGQYVPEGFAIGIDKFTKVAVGSASSMSMATINSAKNSLSRLGDVVNNGTDIQPTIRPVVDMSNVKLTKLDLDSSINLSFMKPVNTLSQTVNEAQSAINTSNLEVIKAINGLREDINKLYSKDEPEISLFVDSKKLASSIAKPMNRQLDILSKRGAY